MCKCYCGECRQSKIVELYSYIKKNKVAWASKAVKDGFHPNETVKAFKKLIKRGHIKMEHKAGAGGITKIYSIKR